MPELSDTEAIEPALQCRAWLRGSTDTFPRTLHRGRLRVEAARAVWWSAIPGLRPVYLHRHLITTGTPRPARWREAVLVAGPATVIPFRYLDADVQLLVAEADAALALAALTDRD